jgi:hypothetical protein
MKWINKIKVVLSQKYVSDNFEHHKNDYHCNQWWCHNAKYETIPLSELKTFRNGVQLKKKHFFIQDDIVKNGFDYNMGYIIATSKGLIMNGHHRYKILIDNFGKDHQITIIRLLDVNNVYFYVFKLFLTRIVVNLLWLFTKKRKEKHIILKF